MGARSAAEIHSKGDAHGRRANLLDPTNRTEGRHLLSATEIHGKRGTSKRRERAFGGKRREHIGFLMLASSAKVARLTQQRISNQPPIIETKNCLPKR
jgi:hypothetical protein